MSRLGFLGDFSLTSAKLLPTTLRLLLWIPFKWSVEIGLILYIDVGSSIWTSERMIGFMWYMMMGKQASVYNYFLYVFAVAINNTHARALCKVKKFFLLTADSVDDSRINVISVAITPCRADRRAEWIYTLIDSVLK